MRSANVKNLASDLRENGYSRVRTITAAETTFEIARRLGSPSVISGVATVQELVPRSIGQASDSSYGRIYGLGQFPLHTDMAHWCVPPHYFLLRCVQPAPQVKTLALHSRHLFAEEDDVTLRRALFRPRRRLDGRLTSLRLFERGRYRWDPVFIVPITASAAKLRERILLRIEATDVEELSLEDPMDCLIIDNWTVLHGRSDVPPGCVHRKIERVYLDSVHI